MSALDLGTGFRRTLRVLHLVGLVGLEPTTERL